MTVTFAGSRGRVESLLVPEAGFELDTFAVSGFPRRIGLGRLPGDIHFVLKGRQYSFPFASSLLLTALVTWLLYAFR